MKIVSNVTDKILSTVFSEFAEEKTFMLEYNISYIANWYFCSDYMSIASNALQKVFSLYSWKKTLRIVQYIIIVIMFQSVHGIRLVKLVSNWEQSLLHTKI